MAGKIRGVPEGDGNQRDKKLGEGVVEEKNRTRKAGLKGKQRDCSSNNFVSFGSN
jgi:hypothetical protein